MKIKTLSLVALLASPVLLAFQPRGTAITFTVEEGSTKSKTFTNSLEMSLDDMSMLMNGQESPMMPEMDLTVTAGFELTVTDEYVKMREGGPEKLLRTYESMDQTRRTEMEMDLMGQVQTQDTSVGSESELEGSTVQFKWSGDGYVASFPDDDGDEELLENLAEDLDLRELLPDGEVEEGDEWKVDALALQDILTPGGDLKLIPEEADSGDSMMGMDSDMGSTSDWFSDDIEGEITATYAGMREVEGGGKVAVIKLAIEISNAVDLTEKMQEGLADAELPPEAGEMEVNSMDVALELEGEATLLWNLAAGCAHSFSMESDLTLTVDISMAVSAQGMDMEIDQTLEFSGTMNAEASISDEE